MDSRLRCSAEERASATEPQHRTHEGFIADARANEKWTGTKKDAPWKASGVQKLSPLAYLPLFDLVWDILMDLMHIVSGFWKRHIFPAFKGKRLPAVPRTRKSWTRKENLELLQEHVEV